MKLLREIGLWIAGAAIVVGASLLFGGFLSPTKTHAGWFHSQEYMRTTDMHKRWSTSTITIIEPAELPKEKSVSREELLKNLLAQLAELLKKKQDEIR